MKIRPKPRLRRATTRILCCVYAAALAFSASAGEWQEVAAMNESRQYPGLARLANGRILAVTGHPLGGNSIASAEIYDPAEDTWTLTGSLNVPRNGVEPGGLTMLPNGKILITGGGTAARSVHEAELYDPASGTWSETGFMAHSRCVHTSTQLEDGRVLVAGGIDWATNEVHASAEVYDYESATWIAAGAMRTPRWNHRAVRLADGRVLVLGGVSNASRDEHVLSSAEIYDPQTGTWFETTPMRHARRAPGAVLLRDGRVLVAGGKGPPGPRFREMIEVDIYNPATEAWTGAAPLAQGRWGPSATLLGNGQVLVAGGMYGRVGRRKSAEIFDPVRGAWRNAGALHDARNGHRAIALDDGRILIVGGYSGAYYLRSCEVYVP